MALDPISAPESSVAAALPETSAVPPAPALAPAPDGGAVIAAEAENDEHEFDDANSAYAESTGQLSTTSLTSSIENYTYENGRRYHAYREGQYILPNDAAEQERLDLLHHIFKLVLGGSLFVAPVSNPHRVLDFGTGTGIWAIDFADEFPRAAVLGTDLSPIQPSWVPPNLTFVVDDVESEWAYRPGEAFDFVHGRAMSGSINDWTKLYDRIYKNLKPGGWIEMQEFETVATSDDGTIENAVHFTEWQKNLNEAAVKFGKELNVADTHKQRLIDAGFVDVVDVVHKIPIGPWPKDPKLKEIGRYQLLHMLDAVEAFTLALFTRVLGWDRPQTEVLMAGVRSDMRNPKYHMYSRWHFTLGRKPETA